MNGKQAIGIFDSGIGGLTVFHEVRRALPFEDILYLGDTAHVPYGTKSPETVLRFTVRNSFFLLEKGVKAIIIACNTASAYGLGSIQKHFRVPVLGVIIPGAKAALATNHQRIGVIGTEGTVRSKAYQTVIHSLNPSIVTVAEACPLLVGLAEEGWTEGEVVDQILKTYLRRFQTPIDRVDALILGCTHYPLFKESIRKILGDSVHLVDSAVEVAKELKATLQEKGLLETAQSPGRSEFFSTDAPDRMLRIGHRFLGEAMKEVTKVEIPNF